MQIMKIFHFIESKKSKAIIGRGVIKMSKSLVIRNDFSCRVTQIKKSNGHSALRSVAYINGQKIVNEKTGEEHNFAHKKGVIETGFILPENIKSNVSDAEFFQHLENNCHASTNTIAYSSIMSLPKELSVEDQKKLVQDFCKHFTDTYKTAVSFAIHEPDNLARKRATLKEIEQYNLPSDIEKLEKETRNNHVHLVMPYCQIEALSESDLTAKRKKKNIGNGFKLGKQVKDFNPIKFGSEIKKEKPDLLNTEQKFVEFMREKWCDYINNSLEQNNKIERYTHKSYKKLGLDISATKHEGEMIKSRVEQGFKMDVHEYNQQQKAKQLTEKDYLDFINRPIPADIANKILSGDFKAEREAIEALKNHSSNDADIAEKLVRDCADAQSLIDELLNKRQLKRDDQKRIEIEKAYSDFITLQNDYADFAKSYSQLENHAVSQQKQLDKDLEKSEKWLKKIGISQHEIYETDALGRSKYETPIFYKTDADVKKQYDLIYKKFKNDVFELSQHTNIEQKIELLKKSADFLQQNSIDLPAEKANLWQKIKGEKVHSFNTLSDFDEVKTVIDERKSEIKQGQIDYHKSQLEAEKQRVRDEIQAKELEASRLETQKRNERERENRLRIEKMYENDPKPTKKSENNNDNDFSM